MFAGWNSMFVCASLFKINMYSNPTCSTMAMNMLFFTYYDFYQVSVHPILSCVFPCSQLHHATCRSQCTRLRSVEQLIPWNLAGSTGGDWCGLDSVSTQYENQGINHFNYHHGRGCWGINHLMYTPSKRRWNWGEQIRNYNRNLRTWRYEIGFQKV